MPSQERNSIIPDWLKRAEKETAQTTKFKEAFLDKTLRSIISIVEDMVFNEKASKRRGLLQLLNPLIKIITFLSFIILIAIQRSVIGIATYLFLGVVLIFLSRLEPFFMFKRVLPITFFTFLIALPATLNLIVDGKDILVLYTFQAPQRFLGISLPQRVSMTEEGVLSMLILLLRVTCSTLFVFLLTLTTRPVKFIKSLMYLVPKLFRSILGISYRYIFFLVKRIEEFIMGFESRRFMPVGSSRGRKWVASRMSLLFSISMELSQELSLAMQSRGYSGENEEVSMRNLASSDPEIGGFKMYDIVWSIFSILFNCLVIWKFLI